MKNKYIEASLDRAVEQSLPHMYEDLAAEEVRKMDIPDFIMEQSGTRTKEAPARKRRAFTGRLAAGLVCLLMAVGLYTGWDQYLAVSAIIDLDVNPSIELDVNQQERVVDVRALNQDGEAILEGLDLKRQSYDQAVLTVIGSMYVNGYLNSSGSAVLVSVQTQDAEKGAAMENNLQAALNAMLAGENSPQVLHQSLAVDQGLRQEAETYQVSAGVMNLIQQARSYDPSQTIEELAQLPLDQLYRLAFGESISDYESDSIYGDSGYGQTEESGGTGNGVTTAPVSGGASADTDYGPAGDGVTDYSDTDYGPAS
ncbi:MAG: hypothetical protein Q4C22_08200, partial [Bacillota bacterium]|nr:hypothetical protein [Bacillota bacterium]